MANKANPKREGVPDPVQRETTDKLVNSVVLAAGQDIGIAEDVPPEEILRKTITTLVSQVRVNGNGDPPKGLKGLIATGLFKYIITALVALSAAYGGIKLAVKNNAEQIESVSTVIDTHRDESVHSGSATKVEVKAIEDKVQTLDKSVVELGTKIDGQETRQKERHDDIKEDFRDLRRRLNRMD